MVTSLVCVPGALVRNLPEASDVLANDTVVLRLLTDIFTKNNVCLGI
jgi:hypothetical protein